MSKPDIAPKMNSAKNYKWHNIVSLILKKMYYSIEIHNNKEQDVLQKSKLVLNTVLKPPLGW